MCKPQDAFMTNVAAFATLPDHSKLLTFLSPCIALRLCIGVWKWRQQLIPRTKGAGEPSRLGGPESGQHCGAGGG